tara:strand:- start:4225 stop:5763 length:1539 start_codon:yes stop_codon:yes gene_type:complete
MSRILAVHNSHNASICETKDNNIIYFQEAERLNKVKKTSDWSILLDRYENNDFDKIIFINAVDDEDVSKNICIQLLDKYHITYKEFIFDINHHFYHACSSYYNSGYKESFVLVIDGHGIRYKDKLEIISCYYFRKNKFKKIFKLYSSKDKEYIENKDVVINTLSLGHFYTMTKEILNYKEEGSVMGLSSYGNEIFTDKFFIEKFNHFSSVQSLIYNMHIESIKDKKILMCRTVQRELERIVLKYISNIIKNKKRNLCVSGGVFQNTVLNSKILDICPNLYVDPFADDSGISMGAALFHVNKNKFLKNKITTLNLGDSPDYTSLDLKKGISATPKQVAKLITEKNIVAIYQGKNELGKRALGNRSFLFDPRDNYAKEKINYLKNREWFRPTAGTVLHEHANEWFDLKSKKETPFMSYVFNVKKKEIPGVTHVDNTCRIQTLKKEENYYYYNLINEFYKLTGVPILLNTSFNLAGQPLVNHVSDAINTLIKCDNKFKFIYFPEIGKIYRPKDFI